jgi:hypothetical protein
MVPLTQRVAKFASLKNCVALFFLFNVVHSAGTAFGKHSRSGEYLSWETQSRTRRWEKVVLEAATANA